MKIQLLPSTFDGDGRATPEQRLTCYIVDDRVAVDAGSLALGLSPRQREQVRDVIITHPHMDHMATLPIFIDDLFALLREPVRVHTTQEIVDLLERDVFNWTVYPRFSGLRNEHGPVMEYVPFRPGEEFRVAHLRVTAVPVNHIVPTVGLVVSDDRATVAFSSDTTTTEEFWRVVNEMPGLAAVLIEAAFPNSMRKLADVSGHLTPEGLAAEIAKLTHKDLDVLAVHLKPTYRAALVEELTALRLPNLSVMEAGRDYEW
ncbi:MAG TPA: 3',5'-cyclic-nucleotide phosphodiesterase [Pyrinomonadaceae bacterium]|nr:3',5'-cyclic-nucleotide phosphodiesterase [Pyrinomonadaceae bacterium]